MNREVRDRGAEMRLTERTRKLIPETGEATERSDRLCVTRMMPVVEVRTDTTKLSNMVIAGFGDG